MILLPFTFLPEWIMPAKFAEYISETVWPKIEILVYKRLNNTKYEL